MMAVVFPILTEVNPVKGPPQGQWTYADWEKLPDDGSRYEIIDGVLYMSTAPSLFHGWIIGQLYDLLGYPAKQQKLAYAFWAPVGVLMPGCEPVQPDFVIVRAERAAILEDRRIRGVPDLIVEVLSPSNADYDEDVKLKAYARAGVPEYAVIDPAKRQLRLYALAQLGQYGAPRMFSEGERLTFACLPTLVVPVADLFAGAPDTTL